MQPAEAAATAHRRAARKPAGIRPLALRLLCCCCCWLLLFFLLAADCRGQLDAQVFEGKVVEGDNRSGGHVITATAGSGPSKQTYNYATERVVGNGSFGVVFQATCLETAETVRLGARAAHHELALVICAGLL
jgi:hypothetical protein